MTSFRDLEDGEVAHVQGSAAKPYEVKNVGGVYSCSCPAWRNQSAHVDRRTCKHIQSIRGPDAETARVGGTASAPAARAPSGRGRAKAKPSAPPLLLAERWSNDVDLTGWWLSEKLDGVRAYWNGEVFLSRLGNVFRAPAWFVDGLPDEPLDGELWVGRRMFQKTTSVVRRADASDHWRAVNYLLFDAPSRDEPFEDRLAWLDQAFPPGRLPHCRAHEHVVCRDMLHLHGELARVESLGGEGLMVRKPGSRYVVGRSSTLLKIKNFLDTEAKVLGHQPGAGRHRGRLGALEVELADGTRFSVGTGFSDAERESPPPVGSLVTVRYQELSDDGVPRFPSYVGVRDDVEWTPARKAQKAAPLHPRAATAARPPAPVRRRFELVEGTSRKFWEVAVEGSTQVVTFGRLGAAGRTQVKEFATPDEALASAGSLAAEKGAKGYSETLPTGGAEPPPQPRRPGRRRSTGAARPSAAPQAERSSSAPARRRFEFVEGTSSKFWEVAVEGSTQIVTFGRLGTPGQTRAKEFSTEGAARASAEALVAEKVAKGYREVPDGSDR